MLCSIRGPSITLGVSAPPFLTRNHNEGRRLRVLLTGNSGFLGKQVEREFTLQGFEVIGLNRRGIPKCHGGQGTRTVQADLIDYASIHKCVERAVPDIVVHLAAILPSPHIPEHPDMLLVNTYGTANLLEACKRVPIPPPVVYASTMSVYDYSCPAYLPVDEKHPVNPRSVYGISKYAGEMLCGHYGRSVRPVVILRIPGIFGPGKKSGLIYNLIMSAATTTPMEVTRPTLRRDFVYVKDVAAAICASIDFALNGNSILCNVSGGQPHTLANIIALVSKVVGKVPPVNVLQSSDESDFYFDPNTSRTLLNFKHRDMLEALADFWHEIGAQPGA